MEKRGQGRNMDTYKSRLMYAVCTTHLIIVSCFLLLLYPCEPARGRGRASSAGQSSQATYNPHSEL